MNLSIWEVRGSISARTPEKTALEKDMRVSCKEPPGILYMKSSPCNHTSRSIKSFSTNSSFWVVQGSVSARKSGNRKNLLKWKQKSHSDFVREWSVINLSDRALGFFDWRPPRLAKRVACSGRIQGRKANRQGRLQRLDLRASPQLR